MNLMVASSLSPREEQLVLNTFEQLQLDGEHSLPPVHPATHYSRISVHDVCEEITKCQEPQKAASLLQFAHQAILRDPLDTFDPSEVFLCLQGAALRFHSKAHPKQSNSATCTDNSVADCSTIKTTPRDELEEESSSSLDNEKATWNVWEESIWATAALARVCVGPAWRLQLHQRKVRLRLHSAILKPSIVSIGQQHPLRPPGNSIHADSQHSTYSGISEAPSSVQVPNPAPRSYSPITASSLGIQSRLGQADVWYPPIPEVLPAAMLRFADSVIHSGTSLFRPLKNADSLIAQEIEVVLAEIQEERLLLTQRNRLAEAQRELVLALCCTTAEESESSNPYWEWSIPGAHGPVASMVRCWLETTMTGLPVLNDEMKRHDSVSASSYLASKSAPVPISSEMPTSNFSATTHTANQELPPDNSNTTVEEAAKMSTIAGKEEQLTVNESMYDEPEQVHICMPPLNRPVYVRSDIHNNIINNKDFILWHNVVEVGAPDWWYALQIARAVTDLISAGWRPPTRTDFGAEIVLCLLRIAEKGMMLRPSDVKCKPSATNREAREERLAAASSAAEAISSLASLGSRGLIPNSTQTHTVTVLCRLQTASTMPHNTASILFPLGDIASSIEAEELELEKDTFVTQRQSGFADTADLLRVLLAHQSSAITSASTLMRMVDVDLSCKGHTHKKTSSSSDETKLHVNNSEMMSVVAVRVLGAALWGKTNASRGVSSLRIFWLPCLDLFWKAASSIHHPCQSDRSSTCSDELYCALWSRCKQSSLAITLEVVIALDTLIVSELILGDALLAPNEWDAFVLNLERCILPWLAYEIIPNMENSSNHHESRTMKMKIYKKLRSGIDTLLLHLGNFLDRCVSFESNLTHPVYDGACRRQMHLLLLRKAVPYMEPGQASLLALAAIRSWSSTAFSTYGSADWCQIASDILSNAFAVYTDKDFGFKGGYVYSTKVRLVALMSITHESVEIDEVLLSRRVERKGDSSQDINKILLVASPLYLLRNTRELYLELINVAILPSLLSILGVEVTEKSVDNMRQAVLPVPEYCHVVRAKESNCGQTSTVETCQNEHTLHIYAINLLGQLFRSNLGARKQRLLFVEILQAISLKEVMEVDSSGTKKLSRLQKGSEDTILDFSPDSCSSGFRCCLEVIRQIELCLCAPFGALPYAHTSIPSIIDALCSVIVTCGTHDASELHDDKHRVTSKIILTIAALLPLCRLSISHDRHLMLLDKCEVAKHIPVALAKILQARREDRGEALADDDEGTHDAVAPFVVVSTDERTRSTETSGDERSRQSATESTVVSFDPIVSTIIFALDSSRCIQRVPENKDVDELLSRLRSTCLDALRSLILSGVSVPFTQGVATAVVNQILCRREGYAKEEKLSRCRAIAALAEYIISRSCQSTSDSAVRAIPPNPETVNFLLRELLHLCTSEDESESAVGCRTMCVVVPTLAAVGNVANVDQRDWISTICETVLNRLQTLFDDIKNAALEGNIIVDNIDTQIVKTDGIDVFTALLSVICDLFACDRYGMHRGLERYCLQTLSLCQDMCSSDDIQLSWCTRLLALKCAVAAIKGMSCEEVKESFSALISDSYRFRSERDIPKKREHEWSRLRGLVSDVLTQRHYEFLELENIFPTDKDIYRSSTQEFYAKETNDTERFQMESKEKCDEDPDAAWLYGDTIISFHLGSSTSRYRGWMEIIIRSPCTRKRRMVRLPNIISLENPELPSSLWQEPSPKPIVLPREPKVLFHLPNLQKKFDINSETVSKALALMDRFDTSAVRLEIAPAKKQTEQSYSTSPDLSSSPTQPTKSVANLLKRAYTMCESECLVGEGECPVQDATGLNLPDSSLPQRTFQSPIPKERINDWLSYLLKDQTNIVAVEEQVRQLFFSESKSILSGEAVNENLTIRRLIAGQRLQRGINILDRTATLQTHKMALLFAGPASAGHLEVDKEIDSSFENLILRATQGSKSFLDFTHGISDLALTRHLKHFSGGLDTSNYAADGIYAATWLDDGCLTASKAFCVFHLVTLMPDGLNNRKRHVGNDNVHIVYVEQGYAFQPEIDRWGHLQYLESAVVSGEFGFVTIFVVLLTQVDLVRVTVRIRAGLPEVAKAALRHLTGSCVVAKDVGPHYVRQVAIRADLACRSAMEDRLGLASNWEDRRQQIHRIEDLC